MTSNPYGLSDYGTDFKTGENTSIAVSYNEKFTLTINDSVIEKLAKENKVPKEISKEFIAKPNRLVENESEISEDLFNTLNTSAREKLDEDKNYVLDGEETLKSVEYVGSYFGIMKDSYRKQWTGAPITTPMNCIVLVYKIQVKSSAESFNNKGPILDLYWYSGFENIIINEDETYTYTEDYGWNQETNLNDIKNKIENTYEYRDFDFSDIIEK